MMRGTIQTPLITISENVYRTLLILYPTEYRREYGSLMVQVFRDVCRDSYRRQGLTGILLWWCSTLLDLTFTVIQERRKVRFIMFKTTFAQLAGTLLMAGGVCGGIAAFSQLQPGSHSSYYGVYQLLLFLFAPSFLLIGLGCIGLALRYTEAFGLAAKLTLWLTGMGGLVMGVGMGGMAFNDSFWDIFASGSILFMVALAVFGLLHLRKPVLPMSRVLPLMIAGGWLVMWLGIMNTISEPYNYILAFLLFFGMPLAWLAIGLAVNRQGRQDQPIVEAA